MGIAFTLGLTSLWPIAIGLALIILWIRRNDSYKFEDLTAVKIVLAIAAIVLVTSLWSGNGAGFYHASAITLAPILVIKLGSVKRWINLLAVIQIVWISIEFLQGVHRPGGISDNGSALGILGLMSLTPLSALMVGMSLSRTALIGFALFAVFRRSRMMYVLLAIAIVAHIFLQLTTDPNRFSIKSVNYSIDLRVATIDGTSTESTPAITAIPNERKLSVFGYGYGGYVHKTNRIQPHNIYILSVWELGIFSVPFWILILALAWRSRNPYIAILFILALVVDEWYTLTEGVFYLVAFHLSTRNLPYSLTVKPVIPILFRRSSAL